MFRLRDTSGDWSVIQEKEGSSGSLLRKVKKKSRNYDIVLNKKISSSGVKPFSEQIGTSISMCPTTHNISTQNSGLSSSKSMVKRQETNSTFSYSNEHAFKVHKFYNILLAPSNIFTSM